jgi:GAF domain-containing protein
LLLAGVVAFALVFFLDTGSIAQWIANHRATRVDEIIVVSFVLLVGLGIFSIRRWLDLHRQAIQYGELHKRMIKVSRDSTLLGDLSDLLQSCLSSEEAHTLITDRAKVLFPGSCGAVCVTASSRDMVEVVASWGQPSFAERFFAPKDCWALRRGRVQLLGADSTVLRCTHIGEMVPKRAMCVPMMAHGEALGLLYLHSGPENSRESGQPAFELGESDQQVAKILAEHAALALANLKLREILRTQSVRDPLTGLYNRRYMEESLERELRRSMRKNCSLGVMMLDVDHFKRFNDTFGHEAGDSVLRALANLFRTQLRGGDVVAATAAKSLR